MATALTLVNRVRRQLRWGDTSAFDDDQSKVVLDRINDSVGSIMSMWDWECDFRTGSFLTMKSTDTTNATVDNGSAFVTTTTTALYTLVANGGFLGASALLIAQNDTAYTPSLQTAFKILYGYSTSTNVSTLELDSYYTGTTSASTTVRTLACEYSLPATVREVLSVWNQNENAYLHDASNESWISDFVRRPHLTINDRSICYAAHRFAAPTVAGGTGKTSAPTITYAPTTSVVIYPTPSTVYRLDYSFLRAHTDLSATTDTMIGIPRAIEDSIVSLAFARCTQDAVGDANAADGLALESRVFVRLEILSRRLGLRRDLTMGDRATMTQQTNGKA